MSSLQPLYEILMLSPLWWIACLTGTPLATNSGSLYSKRTGGKMHRMCARKPKRMFAIQTHRGGSLPHLCSIGAICYLQLMSFESFSHIRFETMYQTMYRLVNSRLKLGSSPYISKSQTRQTSRNLTRTHCPSLRFILTLSGISSFLGRQYANTCTTNG